MRPDDATLLLGGALASYGLDLNRYTTAHAQAFLSRFPDPEAWLSSDARASLISTFAIGETFFMRHPEHFRALSALAPSLAAQRGGAPLRVFSAGCASGEEAYSLAATLALSAHTKFELVAWDINPEAIARAVVGEYRPWSLRGVEEHTTRAWLAPAPCGVRVESWLRDAVRFQVGNLQVDPFPGDLDLVFCRNVLLYFRREAARDVLARFAQALRPGGVLFLGHYDPQPAEDAGLVLEQVDGVQFYRKRRDELRREPPRPALDLRTTGHTAPAFALDASRYGLRDTPDSRMEHVRLLVNQRRTQQAFDALNELRARSPLRADLHVLAALAAEESGDVRAMLDAARKACFLLPEQPGPNYFLSVAFVRNGEIRRAAVHRRIAANALRHARDPKSVVEYSEGLTVGQLRRLVGAVAK